MYSLLHFFGSLSWLLDRFDTMLSKEKGDHGNELNLRKLLPGTGTWSNGPGYKANWDMIDLFM